MHRFSGGKSRRELFGGKVRGSLIDLKGGDNSFYRSWPPFAEAVLLDLT
jgi:hypothetical protein